MATTPKKTVTVWCYRARMNNDEVHLQKRLSRALDESKLVAARKLETTENQFCFVNDHFTKDAITYGIGLAYEKDKAATVMEEDDDAERVNIEHVIASAPTDEKRKQFLEGMHYIAVYKNTILMVQSSGFSTMDMERYLGWFLSKTKKLEMNEAMTLVPQSSAKVAAQLKHSHVKKMEMTTPFADTIEVKPKAKGKDKDKDVTKSITVIDKGAKWLRAIFEDQLDDDGTFEEAIGGNIELRLSIRYKYRTTEGGHHLIDTLAAALRHEKHVETVLHLEDGTKVEGDKLKLTKKASIKTTNGIMNSNELFAEMHKWLKEMLENGLLEA